MSEGPGIPPPTRARLRRAECAEGLMAVGQGAWTIRSLRIGGLPRSGTSQTHRAEAVMTMRLRRGTPLLLCSHAPYRTPPNSTTPICEFDFAYMRSPARPTRIRPGFGADPASERGGRGGPRGNLCP